MKGVGVISIPLQLVFKQALATSAQHDVEAIGQAFQWLRCVEVEPCGQSIRRRLVGNGCDDRIMRNERIALEIHLGDEPLCKARPEYGKMDVRRAPTVDAIAK